MDSPRCVSGLPHNTHSSLQMRRQRLAKQTPKGATPFSAPALFAGSTKAQRRAQAATNRAARGGFSALISAPVARSAQARGTGNMPDTYVLRNRREYIGPVYGSSSFAITSYADNPGLATMYNRTWQISGSHEEYTAVKRDFVFKTASNTSSTGAVVLSYDYDTNDPVPVDLVTALQTKDFAEGQPWHPEIRLSLKKADLDRRGKLFVRTGTPSATTDLKTTDLGKFSISTVGQADGALIGHLWVEFTTILHVFQGPPSSGTVVSSGGTVSDAAIFGTAATYSGLSPVSASASTLTFNQPGYYLIVVNAVGTGTSGVTGAATASSGATVSLEGGFASADALQVVLVYYARVLNGSTISFDLSGATTITSTTTQVAPWFTSS